MNALVAEVTIAYIFLFSSTYINTIHSDMYVSMCFIHTHYIHTRIVYKVYVM